MVAVERSKDKHITKEDLEMELRSLKKEMSTVDLERQLLRVKSQRLENQVSQQQRQMQRLLQPKLGQGGMSASQAKADVGRSLLVRRLRERIVGMQKALQSAEEENEKLKYSQRSAALAELVTVREELEVEVQRLRNLLMTAASKPATSSAGGLEDQKAIPARRIARLESENLEARRTIEAMTAKMQEMGVAVYDVLRSLPTKGGSSDIPETQEPPKYLSAQVSNHNPLPLASVFRETHDYIMSMNNEANSDPAFVLVPPVSLSKEKGARGLYVPSPEVSNVEIELENVLNGEKSPNGEFQHEGGTPEKQQSETQSAEEEVLADGEGIHVNDEEERLAEQMQIQVEHPQAPRPVFAKGDLILVLPNGAEEWLKATVLGAFPDCTYMVKYDDQDGGGTDLGVTEAQMQRRPSSATSNDACLPAAVTTTARTRSDSYSNDEDEFDDDFEEEENDQE